jgi:hypothetical protein
VTVVVVCAMCRVEAEPVDEPAEPDEPGGSLVAPLGWMVERDARTGRVTALCAACARRHARSIEGKLDQAWW